MTAESAMRPFGVASLAFLVLISFSIPQMAYGQVDFSGKTIELIIPYRAGGGTDIWARFNAPFLSKHLPGNPTVIVKNIPGGGGTKGTNRYADSANPDGLSVLGTSVSTQFPFLLGDPRVRYNYADWQVLMVYPSGGIVYIKPEFGINDASELAQLDGRVLRFGSQGTTSSDLVALLGFELLGLDVRPIFGMRGGSAKQLAFERGEATIDYQTSAAYLRNVIPLVEAGKAVPLYTFGSLNEAGQLVRDPAFPELPHFAELYKSIHGVPPKGLGWESWFAFYSAGYGAQKLLIVPKDTPSDIVRAYQIALEAMKDDSDYVAQKRAALGAYDQVTGAAAERLYKLATTISDEPKQWIRNWLRRKYDLKI